MTSNTPDFAYIIYSADVRAESTRYIEQMSPAEHLTAGYSGESRERNAAIAARFTQTEDDSQYDYGYLGKESRPADVRYFPYGYTDPEGLDEPAECSACDGYGEITRAEDDPIPCETCQGRGAQASGQGQHRKWVAELTLDEWRAFASAYCIDLTRTDDVTDPDDAWMPEQYEDTLGSITAEHGHIPAICVDNREGWYGPGEPDSVIHSVMYVSFGYDSDPDATAEA